MSEQPALRRHLQPVQLHLPCVSASTVTFVDPAHPSNFEKGDPARTPKFFTAKRWAIPTSWSFPLRSWPPSAKAYNIPLMIDNTFASHSCAARSSGALTSSCTARPSSWVGTARPSAARSSTAATLTGVRAASPTSPTARPYLSRAGPYADVAGMGLPPYAINRRSSNPARHGEMRRRPSTVGIR